MAEHEHAPIHPVAPRLRNGPKKPHVGPTRDHYHEHHSQTVGEQSDKWWEKVSRDLMNVSHFSLVWFSLHFTQLH